ncbi:RING-H2 finger protein ATL63 [Gossypium australe]|uniref:RING-H2 finger protein ATL63 n=1 Tax=Gossypium australe TaxID=47621 RepID=A0A5B6VPH2_9ROSI|nr:RING-H2 finger protein ATL63 [Gossypium australe]
MSCELCDTFKCNKVTSGAICLRLFPFSLCDHVADWLDSLESDPFSCTVRSPISSNSKVKIYTKLGIDLSCY